MEVLRNVVNIMTERWFGDSDQINVNVKYEMQKVKRREKKLTKIDMNEKGKAKNEGIK